MLKNVSPGLIENVKELKIALNELTIHDLNVYSMVELYYKVAHKLNEVINELSRFEGVLSDEVIKQNEKLIYLLGEGLEIEVVKEIDNLIKKGFFEEIINEKIFSDLNNKMNTFKSEIDSQLEHKATKIDLDVERKRIDNLIKLESGSTTGDAELIDIRTNNNGVIYNTAGESVRAIGNKKLSNLNMVNALKNNFELLEYTNVDYILNDGFYNENYELNAVSSTHTVLNVIPNEIYRFKVRRNWTLPIYFLLDGNNSLMYVDKTRVDSEIKEIELQIPHGCSKLVIQANLKKDYFYISKLNNIRISNIKNEQISTNAITYNNLEKGIQELFVPSYGENITDMTWIDGAYIMDNGKTREASSYSYCKYKVYEGQKFKLSSSRQWEACGWTILDTFGQFITSDSYPAGAVTEFIDEIVIPKNGAVLCFNNDGGNSFKYLQSQSKYTPVKQPIYYNDLPSEIKNMYTLTFKQVTDFNWVTKCYMRENGTVVDLANSDSTDNNGYAEFDVVAGTTFKITGQRGWEGICYLIKNDSGKVLLHDGRSSSSDTKIYDEEFTIPEGGTKLFVGKYGFKELYIKNNLIIKNSVSPLRDKVILFNGDSICQGVVNGGGYAKIIKEKTGCIIENRAIGGGTLSTGGAQHKIVDDIKNMRSTADLICFEGGINDYWIKRKLGTITPINDWTGELDTTTIVGALESIFRQSLIKWEGVPICMIFTHPIQQTRWNVAYEGGHTMQEQTEVLKEVCKKYSIPYLDLFNESGGFNCNLDYISSKYTTSNDGCHPNELGYKRFYAPQIIKFFEKLITID